MSIAKTKQRKVLITGASSGIGQALFFLLAKEPHELFLMARRAGSILDPPELHPDTKIHRYSVDLSQEKEVSKAIRWMREQTSELDCFFNNAGISAHGRFEDLSQTTYHTTFATNYFGPVFLIQGLLPMLLRSRGIIVTTSTVSALYGVPGRAAYSGSKAALHASLESLRIEHSKDGLRCALVCVPYTKTNLRNRVLSADGRIVQEAQAKGKIKTPEEVAQVLHRVSLQKNPRLITFNTSGHVMKFLRFFAPGLLERIMAKKLEADYQKPE